jgi:acid phosphatase type 7
MAGDTFVQQRKFVKTYSFCFICTLFLCLGSCVQLPLAPNPDQPVIPPFTEAAISGPVLFSEGFESGGLQAWAGGSGLAVQQQVVAEGAWAARGTMSGAGAWAYATLLSSVTELTASLRVQVLALSGSSSVNFLKLRSTSGTVLAEVYVTPAGLLGVRNNVTGVATNSAVVLAAGSWRSLSLRALVAGPSSRLEVRLDGVPVPGLQLTTNLGTTSVARVQVGENVSGRTADLAYDAVLVTGATPVPPPGSVLFADGFESGNLQAWTAGSGLVVQQQLVSEGVWAARGTMTGGAAWVYKTLATPTSELTLSLRVQLLAISAPSSVNFLKVRTASGSALAEVYFTPSGRLGLRNNVTGVATDSTVTVATGVWRTVALRIVVAGSSSRLEVRLDGVPVAGLQQTVNLGTTPVGRVQVGENVSGRTADLVYDAVVVTGATDPVLVAAGDIACDPLNPDFNAGFGFSNSCRQKAVSDLILTDPEIRAVAALGDIQYYCGGAAAFAASYDKSWGRLKPITYPSVGNHEYITSNPSGPATDCDPTGLAAGYFGYFGAAAGASNGGYYSYDLGTWHIIVLNSNCPQAGGCGTGSAQDTWLQADLAAHPVACTLAYWHIPLWSSGGRAAQNSAKFVQRLYAAGADVILTGHDHTYERFAPQNPAGLLDTVQGLRAFVVGTGGANHTTIPSVAANSEVRNADTFGFLRLTLHPGGYDWRFVPEPGKTFSDSGSASCH